jgi:hypothetical protein
MSPEQTVRNLSMLRLAIGAGAWLTPNVASRLFGLDPSSNPQGAYLGRLFGVRDIALGLGTMQSTGDARRRWLTLGVVCDAADTAAALFGRRGGYLSGFTALSAGATAAAATALGVMALQAPSES